MKSNIICTVSSTHCGINEIYFLSIWHDDYIELWKKIHYPHAWGPSVDLDFFGVQTKLSIDLHKWALGHVWNSPNKNHMPRGFLFIGVVESVSKLDKILKLFLHKYYCEKNPNQYSDQGCINSNTKVQFREAVVCTVCLLKAKTAFFWNISKRSGLKGPRELKFFFLQKMLILAFEKR